jgi:ubiquinone/menaquinone biosynthesis C-methylase UbiE
VGTGLTIPYYPSGVRLQATDPDRSALRRAAERANDAAAYVSFAECRGEALPFPNATFDAVVAVSVLCSVGSMGQTLDEVKRVLKPGGQLCLLEHVGATRSSPDC